MFLRNARNQTLNKAYPDWLTSGVFSSLENPPWSGVVSAASLDTIYHGNHSGQKYISPLMYNFLNDSGVMTADGIAKIASAIEANYFQKWRHLWTIYTTAYTPLNSYEITETHQKGITGSHSETNNETRNLKDQRVSTENINNGGTVTSQTVHGHIINHPTSESFKETDYGRGFNSDDENPPEVGSMESSRNNTSTETHSGTDTTTDTNSLLTTDNINDTVDRTGTDNRNISGSNSSSEEGTRRITGNKDKIPAEMLSADRDFWLQNYFQIIFDDLDALLTLPIYAEFDPLKTIL